MKKHLIMLAAGMGSRLRPLTDVLPKCLLSIGSETLLGQNLNRLSFIPDIEITIVTGYLGDKIKAEVTQKFSHLKVRFVSNSDYATTNNAYSLSLGLEEEISDFALMDGDLILDSEILGALTGESFNYFYVDPDSARLTAEAMKVKTKANGSIELFSKAMNLGEAKGEYIGLARFGKEWTLALKNRLNNLSGEEKKNAYYEDICNWLLKNELTLPPLHIQNVPQGSWMEIDTIEDLEEARKRFSSRFIPP